MKSASSLARKLHVFATSAGVEGRPRGIVDTNAALFSSVSGFPRKRWVLNKKQISETYEGMG